MLIKTGLSPFVKNNNNYNKDGKYCAIDWKLYDDLADYSNYNGTVYKPGNYYKTSFTPSKWTRYVMYFHEDIANPTFSNNVINVGFDRNIDIITDISFQISNNIFYNTSEFYY